jgi:stress-induced-phosphoprotein 1
MASAVRLSDAADALKAKGNAALQRGDFGGAVAAYTAAIAACPHHHVLYGNRAAARIGLRAFDDAIRDAEACISLEPAYIKGFARLATALAGRGDVVAALDACGEGLAAVDEFADAK